MNRIVARLSSKHQITVPKSIRDILGIKEKDIMEFLVQDNIVRVVKGEDIEDCPFCAKHNDIEKSSCLVCHGKGEIEKLDKALLKKLFFEVFNEQDVSFQVDNRHFLEIVVFQVETDDETFILYRDLFQLEAAKLVIQNWEIEKIQDKAVQQELVNLFALEKSRKAVSQWLARF